MDRFIDIVQERLPDGMTNLKSNMDRFIEGSLFMKKNTAII